MAYILLILIILLLAAIFVSIETLPRTSHTGALDNAFASTSEAEQIFPELVADALAKLKKASGNLHTYHSVDSRTKATVEEIGRLAEFILDAFSRLDEKKGKTKTRKKAR